MEAAQIYTGHYCTKQVVSALPSLALCLTAMQAAGLDTTLHSQVQSLPWLLGSSSRAATTPAQNPNQTKVKPEFLWHSLSPTCWCPAISGSCFRLFSSSKDGYISVTLCSRALREELTLQSCSHFALCLWPEACCSLEVRIQLQIGPVSAS